MNNKKKRELTNEEIDENIFEMCNICSTTDCTGLIQVVPRTEAELESYEELYPFRPPFFPAFADQDSRSFLPYFLGFRKILVHIGCFLVFAQGSVPIL